MKTFISAFFFFQFFSIAVFGQCLISGLNVTPSECNSNGDFFVTISFDHGGTSQKFRVLGNGVNYGTFDYANLPIVLGPLKANCVTEYEFVIRDFEIESCFSFKNLGKKCCANLCDISFENLETGVCNGSNYSLFFDLNHNNAPENGFDLFNNGQFYGYYQYSDLPLNLLDFPSSNTATFNEIIVCANDNKSCCDTTYILNPCICTIYKIQGQVVNCNAESETFSLKLNFKHNLTSDSFFVGGNAVSYGKFAYSDLPITISNLSFSPTTEYEFLIVDKNDAFCFASYDLGIVNTCNFECHISNVIAKPKECIDSLFYADITFTSKNTSLGGFSILGNGHNYGTFEYGEPYYTVGPIEADCHTKYEFIVKDQELADCMAHTSFTEPICCNPVCEISELHIFEYCENNILIGYDINFNHSKSIGQFVLKVNNKVIGTFAYENLPLKVTNISFDLPNVVFRIFDTMDESCHLIKEYKFECFEEPVCSLYDLTVKASACNNDNKFYALLKFKVTNKGNHGFIVKVNGQIWDTLEYGKDVYEIGPLNGDCATLYKFFIQDVQFNECTDEFGLSEKVCCGQECKISNPVVSFSVCDEGKFDLTVNFTHTETTQKFRIKLNGVVKGPFSYADLPVLLENLEMNKAYEIVIWDAEKETCRLTFTIPAIQCPSGTNDSYSKYIHVINTNEFIEIGLDEVWLPCQIKLLDLTGKTIYIAYSQPTTQVDISSLIPGLYILSISNSKNIYSKKIFKY